MHDMFFVLIKEVGEFAEGFVGFLIMECADVGMDSAAVENLRLIYSRYVIKPERTEQKNDDLQKEDEQMDVPKRFGGFDAFQVFHKKFLDTHDNEPPYQYDVDEYDVLSCELILL